MRQAQKCSLPLRHPCDGGVFKYAECLEWESFPSKELQLQLKIVEKHSEARDGELKTECHIISCEEIIMTMLPTVGIGSFSAMPPKQESAVHRSILW